MFCTIQNIRYNVLLHVPTLDLPDSDSSLTSDHYPHIHIYNILLDNVMS